jgi:hypothetical protein
MDDKKRDDLERRDPAIKGGDPSYDGYTEEAGYEDQVLDGAGDADPTKKGGFEGRALSGAAVPTDAQEEASLQTDAERK